MGKRGRPVLTSACNTCKIRRVKCDETKPACLRCLNTGRRCDGYPLRQALALPQEVDAQELRSFQYFCERTSFELSSYYDEDFWRHETLALAQSHRALWHITVAVGSIHEALKQQAWSRNDSSRNQRQPVFALQQCNKAIKLLTPECAISISSSLMLTSCILFMAFDMIQNRLDSSLNHLEHGMTILGAWRESENGSATLSERTLIEEHLFPIIARFSESCNLFDPAVTATAAALLAQTRVAAHANSRLPPTFVSLNQVSSSLHSILDSMFLNEPGTSTTQDKNTPRRDTNDQASDLKLWRERFQLFLDTLNPKLLGPATRRRLTLLEIHHDTAHLLYVLKLSTDEMAYDEHLGTFQRLVKQCKDVIQIEEETAASSKPSMAVSFDLGIIMPLYLTASRCRHPVVRRQALQILLTSPRREGIYLSWVTGNVAAMVIEIEEMGLHNPQTSADVPVENRIDLVQMHYNPRPTSLVDGEEYFTPILQLTWISSTAIDEFEKPVFQSRTIKLPQTQDDRPGARPYWVLLPKGNQPFSNWKLLIGKKTFNPPQASAYTNLTTSSEISSPNSDSEWRGLPSRFVCQQPAISSE